MYSIMLLFTYKYILKKNTIQSKPETSDFESMENVSHLRYIYLKLKHNSQVVNYHLDNEFVFINNLRKLLIASLCIVIIHKDLISMEILYLHSNHTTSVFFVIGVFYFLTQIIRSFVIMNCNPKIPWVIISKL